MVETADNQLQNEEDAVKPPATPARKSRRVLKWMLLLLATVLLVAGICFFVKSRQHKTAQQQTKTLSQDEIQSDFQKTDAYKGLNIDQKIEVRLGKVSQYSSVNAYQGMLSELDLIKKDYPEAEKNISFLMYEFITNYQLDKQSEAISYAKKVKALNKAIPESFIPWKDKVTQYAAK